MSEVLTGRVERATVPQDACWDITAAADGDYEVWLEVIEDALGGGLAELVDLDLWCLAMIAFVLYHEEARAICLDRSDACGARRLTIAYNVNVPGCRLHRPFEGRPSLNV